MRPWIATILSYYGRDRAAYASFEQLFDPVLPPMALPIENLYLQKIHATFALIEWLYSECKKRQGRAIEYLWPVLSDPTRSGPTRDAVLEVLGEVVRAEGGQNGPRQRLEQHLVAALRIDFKRDPERLRAILWEPPRGLLLEVIPTLMRRLWAD